MTRYPIVYLLKGAIGASLNPKPSPVFAEDPGLLDTYIAKGEASVSSPLFGG